jgi:hypothetical protein
MCKITFRQKGQSDIIKTVEMGESLTDIPTPKEKKGYEIYWEQTTFDNVIKNIIVNAVENAKTYEISYDSNGGVPIEKTTTVTYDKSVTLETTTKDGFIFAGYEFNGTSVDVGAWNIDAENIVLKAKWDYQITFKKANSPDTVVTLHEGEVIPNDKIPALPTLDGYDYSWSITDFSTVKSNTVVTAVAEPKTYKVYYNITEENIPYGTQVLKDEKGYYFPVKFGQEFNKQDLLIPINTNADLLFDYWSGNNAINSTVWNTTHDVKITPNWRSHVYVWTFKLNDLDTGVSIKMDEGDYLSKSDSRIPALPTKIGYEFSWDKEFWALQTGGTVIAVSTPKTYTIVFSTKEGESVSQETIDLLYGQPFEIDVIPIHEKGLYFIGWSYNGEQIPLSGENWNKDWERQIIVEPIWKAKVTFIQEGVSDVVKYVDVDSKLTEIPALQNSTKYRYYWDFDFEKTITENVVIEAKEKVFKVTLVAVGGTVETTTVEVRFGREYSLPMAYFKNFDFDCWVYGEREIPLDGIWNIESDVTLEAKRGAYHTGNY